MLTASEVLREYGPAHGLTPREVQCAYTDYVAGGIACARKSGSGQLFAEASTGTGKTIGYLTSALLDCVEHNTRAIIATHTIALQRQIMESDLPRAIAMVQDATGKRLTFDLRIGKRNFVDPDRVALAYIHKKTKKWSPDEVQALENLHTWADENPGAQIADFLRQYDLDTLPCGILLEDICISTSTNQKGAAYLKYREHAARSKSVDVLVTNHSLLLIDAIYRDIEVLHDADDQRKLGVIIVDECDRLPEAARSLSSDMVPLHDLLRALERWQTHIPDDVTSAACSAVSAAMAVMHPIVDATKIGERSETIVFWRDLRKEQADVLHQALRKASLACMPYSDLEAPPDFVPQESRAKAFDDLRALRRLSRSLVDILGDISTQNEKSHLIALRWSPTRDWPSVKRFELHPARVLARVWREWTTERIEKILNGNVDLARQYEDRRATALVLTSATISPPSASGAANFTRLSLEYGIYPKDNACQPYMEQRKTSFEPSNFGRVNFVFSHPDAPSVYLKNDPHGIEIDDVEELARQHNMEWVAYSARAVAAAHSRGGRVLVLTNSYEATKKIARAAQDLGLSVIEKKRDTPADSCLRSLAADSNGIFISPGAWEGFDPTRLVGPDGRRVVLRHVVITQTPYPKPDGSLQLALLSHLMSRGVSKEKAQSIVYGNIRDAALCKFRQGFGRGIRSHEDHFTLWLVDPRFPRSTTACDALVQSTNSSGVDFFYAIPKRFRESHAGLSAWELGDVLALDGSVIERAEMLEMA